jgi:hypothetical protein
VIHLFVLRTVLNAIVKAKEKELILVDLRTEETTKFLNVRKLSNAGKLDIFSPNFILKKLVLIKIDNDIFFSDFPNRIEAE